MKQLANLYVPELHPRKQSLTFTRAAGVVAAAAVLAVVLLNLPRISFLLASSAPTYAVAVSSHGSRMSCCQT